MVLAAKQCVPCKGAKALSADAAKAMLPSVPGWEMSQDGKWLVKKYAFSNFAEAVAFVNRAAPLADAEHHHPDIALGWGYAVFKLQTHDVGGLHENDFIMAAKFNALG